MRVRRDVGQQAADDGQTHIVDGVQQTEPRYAEEGEQGRGDADHGGVMLRRTQQQRQQEHDQ